MNIQPDPIVVNGRKVHYLYNLGTVHFQSKLSFDEFHYYLSELIKSLPKEDLVLCFTNATQANERKYLKDLGFSTVEVSEQNYMRIHTIEVGVLSENIEKLKPKPKTKEATIKEI